MLCGQGLTLSESTMPHIPEPVSCSPQRVLPQILFTLHWKWDQPKYSLRKYEQQGSFWKLQIEARDVSSQEDEEIAELVVIIQWLGLAIKTREHGYSITCSGVKSQTCEARIQPLGGQAHRDGSRNLTALAYRSVHVPPPPRSL